MNRIRKNTKIFLELSISIIEEVSVVLLLELELGITERRVSE